MRAYDEKLKQWIDDEWQEKHGWLLVDMNGDPVLIQDVEGTELRNVEVDYVDGDDLCNGWSLCSRVKFK